MSDENPCHFHTSKISQKKEKWNDLVVREGRMADPTLTGTIAEERDKQEKRDI